MSVLLLTDEQGAAFEAERNCPTELRHTGHNIYAPNLGGTNLKERETDFDLGYTVQSGWLKNLGLRARYAMYDNNMLSTANIKPVNETRINIDYTWKFK